jgi:fatty-acyl-CoA synthase
MGFIDENRKVSVTAGGKTWIFKTLDGSLLEAPAGATDVMTEKVTEIAQKYLEPISGTDEDSFELLGRKVPVYIDRYIDLTVGEVLTETAKLYPDQTALITFEGDRSITYKEFEENARAFGKYLLSVGIKKGDIVGLWMANGIESMIASYAAIKIGAAVAAFTPYEKQEQMEELVRRSQVSTFILYRGAKTTENIEMLANDMYPEIKTQKYGELSFEKAPLIKRVILVGADGEYDYPGVYDFNKAMEEGRAMPDDGLEAAQDAINLRDLAFVIFTSGSTGFPKGVMLSHLNVVENSNTLCDMMGLTHDDKMMMQIQLFHTFGSVASGLCGIQRGIPIVLARRFKPADSLVAIEREQCTVVSGVPTMFIGFVEELKKNPDKYNIDCMDKGITAGAACPEQMVRDIQDIMHVKHLIACYGLTETGPCVSGTSPDDSVEIKGNTVGRLVPGVKVKFINPDTLEEVPAGQPGEICVKGYGVMLGYLGDPKKTRETYTPDGWLRTGDSGYLDEDGVLRLGDRLKDLIIRSGENISPGNIEKFIQTIPGVSEVYAIGVKHYKYGEIVGAFVRPDEGSDITAEDIRDQCDGNVPTLSIPTYYWFVGKGGDIEEFPLLSNGKVSKPELRKIAEATKANKTQLSAHKPKN